MPPPQPIPAPAGPQYAQQFLSTALSQRGPAALPYSEDVKWLIRQHLLSLSDAFPSLHPKSATYTHNDGRSVFLLQAEGTIPISFRGAVYNFPVIIWLLESYPRRPPQVFLCPTRDMVVKPGHTYVDPSGLLHDVPYLASWVFPSSNLVDLVRSLSHLFGVDPPLFSRPNPSAASPANTTPPPRPKLDQTPSSSTYSPSRIYPPYASTAGSGRFPPSPQIQPSPTPAPGRPTEDPADVFRRNAIAKILDSVHADMPALRKAREAEMEGLFSTQAELRRRGEELERGVREMVEEKEGLEQQLQLNLMNTDVLGAWVRDNQGRRPRADAVDVDQVFETADALSRQMLECTSADLAVDDTIYALDKALQEGFIPFDTYIKSIRMLSREQFFHRTTASKVRAAQLQAQVTSIAARAPHYVS